MPNYDPTLDQVYVALGERPHEFTLDLDQKDDEIYVNIMASEAVCITREIDNKTVSFHAVYYRWAPDHGVEEEHWIGSAADAESVADLVLPWIERYEAAQARMAAEMERAFGGGE
ncbi:MAG TPA: hypothetical protein VNS88_07230 [Nitrospiraceae bacterium]|nr:hypothetical protein [Nitrospiraceae bacterium]